MPKLQKSLEIKGQSKCKQIQLTTNPYKFLK